MKSLNPIFLLWQKSFVAIIFLLTACELSADNSAYPSDSIYATPPVTLEDAKMRYDYPKPHIRADVRTPPLKKIVFVVPSKIEEVQQRYYALAAEHFRRRGAGVIVEIVDKPPAFLEAGIVVVYAGIAGQLPTIDKWLHEEKIPTPSQRYPGSEGFAVQVYFDERKGNSFAMIAASDARGVLFGLGWLLLQTRVDDHGVTLPKEIPIFITAPRMRLRSANCNPLQSMDSGAARVTDARRWSFKEGMDYIQSQWLLGANMVFHGWGSSVPIDEKRYNNKTGTGVSTDLSKMARDYDIAYAITNSINGINRSNMRKGWEAIDNHQRHNANVCVSNPQARAFLLDIKSRFFKHAPRIDYVIFAASDVAGCECDACAPWPHTFWNLTKELSDALHKYHPDAEALFTNQDFQISDNRWFFEKIMNENPRWLNGFCHAPGGNEASTYGGVVPNQREGAFAGLFPLQQFLRNSVRYLSPQRTVLAHVDISHWKRAEYGLPVIDPMWSEVYARRTFNARPDDYCRILLSYMPYVDGFLGYSEGNYDDFNKFLLLRLAWDPEQTPRQIAREYYAYYLCEDVADLLAEAVLQLEQNTKLPLLSNGENIRKVYQLVSQSRDRIPDCIMEKDWRYAMLARRAALDLYHFERQSQLQKAFETAIARLDSEQFSPSQENIAAIIDSLKAAKEETSFQKKLWDEATYFDDAADRGAGVRSIALNVIRKYDGVGVEWLIEQLKIVSAIAAVSKAETSAEIQKAQLSRIREIVNYDRVGEAEFYENGGTIQGQPHFDFSTGELYYGLTQPDLKLLENSRPSQRSYNYAYGKRALLRYRFTGLDTTTDYELTFVYGNPKNVSFAAGGTNAYRVLVNGEPLVQQIPSGNAYDRVSVRVPRSLFADGNATIAFLPDGKQSHSVCISELWLRKFPKE